MQYSIEIARSRQVASLVYQSTTWNQEENEQLIFLLVLPSLSLFVGQKIRQSALVILSLICGELC